MQLGRSILSFSFFVGVASLLLSASAFAHGPLFVLEGVNASGGTPCNLQVFETYFENNEQADPSKYRAVVAVQLDSSHGSAHATPLDEHGLLLTVQPSASSVRLLEGKDPKTGNVLKVSLPEGVRFVDGAVALSYNWLHGDHYHRDVCKNLRKVEPKSDHGQYH